MSSSSSVFVSGMVVLENPCTISARVTLFTALIYVGSPSLEQIQGSLRYFKPLSDSSEVEYPDTGLYSVTFVASKVEPSFDVNTNDEEERAKFHLVGDIKKLCLLQAWDPDDPAATWTIDPRQQVCVHVCCLVTTDDQRAGTFTATPEQYTSVAADAKRAQEEKGEVVHKPTFPLCGYFEDLPRFSKSKKPTPYSNRYCGFSGFLTGMSSALEGEKMVDRFRISVDTVAFLGGPAAPAAPKGTPVQNSAKKAGSGSRTWSFSTPATNPLKRRRENGDDAGPSSSPSTFGV